MALDVMPLPQTGRPDNFAGVVGNYSISAKLDRSIVALGDVATLTIKISGRGNLKTVPAPTLPPLDDFKIYEPKYTENISTTGNYMEGEKSWEYVLSPKAKGTNQIGAISLPYFDPDQRGYRVARTEQLTLKVEGGQLTTTPVSGDDRSQLRALRRDISFIHTSESEGVRPSSSHTILAYLWILLPPLVNLVAFAYRRHRENRQTDLASYLRSRAYSQFKKSLKKARSLANPTDAKLFYHLLTDSLARYAAHKLSLSAQSLTLQSVMEQMEERRIEPELRQRFQLLWNDAEYGLFGAGQPGVTAMEKLLRSADQIISVLDGKL